METIESLTKRIESLEQELYETKMIAYGTYASIHPKYSRMGYKFNLMHPTTLNSKLQWLAVNYWDRHPARYYINDKYFFKYYMTQMFGTEHIVPLLGVYDDAKDIDFHALPTKFVLKRTLGGAAAEVKLVHQDEDDVEEVRAIANKWMHDPNNAKARLIAEEELEFEGDKVIDYKFYVCNGKAMLCMCGIMNKSGGHRSYVFYDLNWNRYQFRVSQNVEDVPRPENLSEMIALSEKIGKEFPLIRVDLFLSMGKLYIGELTGLPFNALGPYGFAYDKKFGNSLRLPSEAEMEADFCKVYQTFPELTLNPIFLKGKNPSYRIIQPNNPTDSLPLPPKYFMQPSKA